MSGLIGELEQLLDDDDPAWHAFGLNRPSDPSTPDVSGNVEARAGLPGSIHVSWDASQRAGRHKIYLKENGSADHQLIATAADCNAVISGLKASDTVGVPVTAANRAGESLPCSAEPFPVPSEAVA